MESRGKKFYLAIEFILLFFGIPLFLLNASGILHPSLVLIPIVFLLIFYLRKHNLNWDELKFFRLPYKFLKTNVFLVILSSLAILACVYIFDRNKLFNLPRLNFKIWILLFLFYPLLSASLQEILFRVFMFRRYFSLFEKNWMVIIASGVTFSFAHILYTNVISLILTLIMGIYLAYLYYRTHSFLLIAIIHSFYGNLIFTIGLGEYFWIDMYKYL